jgi:hypothetical protein
MTSFADASKMWIQNAMKFAGEKLLIKRRYQISYGNMAAIGNIRRDKVTVPALNAPRNMVAAVPYPGLNPNNPGARFGTITFVP